MDRRLLIIGASARAAAASARLAGFEPMAADRFADQDLERIAETHQVDDYPSGMTAAAERFPDAPWLYTGAMENHPRIVARISRQRRLWGNNATMLRRVRNPWILRQLLADHDLAYPEVRTLDEVPSSGRWLCKPFRSAGGSRILERSFGEPAVSRSLSPSGDPRLATAGDRLHAARVAECTVQSHYWQRWVDGLAACAVFVAAGGRALLVGVSAQLVGTDWSGASRFGYSGSVTPCNVTDRQRCQLERLGNCLSRQFGMVGLIGVDLILGGQTLTTLEVNPRYTASVEVLERSLGIAAIAWHVRACRDGSLPPAEPRREGTPCGKAIVYACRPTKVTQRFFDFAGQSNATSRRPVVADIPRPGQEITPGRPITTVLAECESFAQLEDTLRRGVRVVRDLLA